MKNKNIRRLIGCLSFSFILLQPLSLFAADDWAMADTIVAAIKTPNIPTKQYSISKFGAKAGFDHDARPAIMAAIAKASESGGGMVVIPKGEWMVAGPIHLKSRINLHLAKGAHLLFSPDPKKYLPVVKTKWEGTELMSYSPLIYAANVEDVAITGEGVIDGNGNSEFIGWGKLQANDMKTLRHMGATGVPLAKRIFAEGTYLRPALIQFMGAKRVLLEGYTSLNSPFWVNHLVYADHVTVRKIKVDSHISNNDGIDIESCDHVLIEHSWFRTGDDSVVIKSGRDLDGRTIGIPSQNIVVRHNDMGGEDGIGLGSEMSGGIKNVFFTDNILRAGDSAFRFKSNMDRGGVVEHIRIKDTHVENFKNLFWFQLNYATDGEAKFPPTYKDIVFENITVDRAEVVLEMHAQKESPIGQVTFKDIKVKEAGRVFNIDNAENLIFENVNVGDQKIDGHLSWK